MNLVPTDKHDLASVQRLKHASNAEIEPYLKDLVSWVADINWPVAHDVASRLRNCGVEIIPHIKRVLMGNDDILKYNVIAHVVCHLDKKVMEPLMQEIIRIKDKPTEGELQEDVPLVAGNAIAAYKFNA